MDRAKYKTLQRCDYGPVKSERLRGLLIFVKYFFLRRLVFIFVIRRRVLRGHKSHSKIVLVHRIVGTDEIRTSEKVQTNNV